MIRSRQSFTATLVVSVLAVVLTLAIMGLFLVLPLVVVFAEAASKGWAPMWEALEEQRSARAATGSRAPTSTSGMRWA